MANPWDTVEAEKQRCRELFASAIAKYTVEGPHKAFLLLPSSEAHDAKLLWSYWPQAKIVGLERDQKLFQDIDRRYSFHIENLTVEEYALLQSQSPRPRQFDAAFLDYTGIANPNKLKEITLLVKQCAKTHFVLAITFQKSPRGKSDEIAKFIAAHSALDEIEEKSTLKNFFWTDGSAPSAAIRGTEWNKPLNLADAICTSLDSSIPLRDINIVEAIEYRATEKSVPMYFLLLKLIKLEA